jgi:hypothetical protein
MSCGGGHLGFPIGIKNRNLVKDIPMIFHLQFEFSQFISFREEDICPMGKCSNAFFSETTNMIKARLYKNVHWMVLYKLYVFCSDMKFKMAATAGLSYHICTFWEEGIWTFPHWVQTLIYALRWWPSWIYNRHKNSKLCRGPSNDHSWRSFTNFVFFMLIGIPRWLPLQDIVFT